MRTEGVHMITVHRPFISMREARLDGLGPVMEALNPDTCRDCGCVIIKGDNLRLSPEGEAVCAVCGEG